VSIRSAFIVICLLCSALFAPEAPAESPKILVLGDSLSAAYGMRVEQGWVALLQARLEAKGYGHRVINASSSGETTGGALARLPRALERHRPAVVIIELGGNDGLRGLPVAEVRANFESLVRLSREAGAKVLLIGMRIPPNYGPAYAGVLPRRHRARRLADARRRPAPERDGPAEAAGAGVAHARAAAQTMKSSVVAAI
jgi:acyl-CoA thioesterase-1